MITDFIGLRAALFDLDGTLVRTFIDFPAMRTAMREFAARYGASDAIHDTDDILEIVRRTAQTVGGKRGVEVRREAYALLETMEEEGCAHPEPIAGASELLHRLREERQIPVAIITRNSRAISERLLQRMDLAHDLLVAREDVPEFKPHPAPVLFACAHLKVAPAETFLVGDLWADIAAGFAAGVGKTIGIQWHYDPPERFARCPPDIEVSTLQEVARLLFSP